MHPILTIPTFYYCYFKNPSCAVFSGKETAETGMVGAFALLNLACDTSALSHCAATKINIFWRVWKLPSIIQGRWKGQCWPSDMLMVDKVWVLGLQTGDWAVRNKAFPSRSGKDCKCLRTVLVQLLSSTEPSKTLLANYKTDEHAPIFWHIKGNLLYPATSVSLI